MRTRIVTLTIIMLFSNYLFAQKSSSNHYQILREIDNIEISNSRNDCLDLSYGKYKLKNLDLNNCGDKGISVGENTKANFFNIKIINANIGIATKDSSFVTVDKSEISMVKNCFATYRKKQEFSGGYMKIEISNCNNFVKEIYEDKHSTIIVVNSIN